MQTHILAEPDDTVAQASEQKVFCFFFSKKKAFLACYVSVDPA